MSYTQNGDKFIYTIKVENQSSYTDTNVVTVIDPLPAGIAYSSHTNTQGVFVPGTLSWTIPSLPGKTATYLYLKVVVNDVLEGPFSINVTTTGSLVDPELGNNTATLTVGPANCSPAGGGNPDTGCACIDVSLNDTKCTHGETQWRLDANSIVNGELVSWDELTGKAIFTHIDPSENITGTYGLWCVIGVDEYQVSCNVPFTISPTIVDKNVFDHIIKRVTAATLSPADIVVLTAQYPGLTIEDYCWGVLRNADGIATSGFYVDCDPAKDTRFIHVCSEEACEAVLSPVGVLPADVILLLPEDYTPAEGDVVYIDHPTSISIYTFNGLTWVRTCGCKYNSGEVNTVSNIGTGEGEVYKEKVGTDLKVRTLKAGTNVTITNNTNDITISAELAPGDGDGWGDDIIHHAIGSNSTGDGTVSDPLVVIPTAVAVSDTSDLNLSISGDGVMTPFTISGQVNEGSPIPVYTTGVPGTGPFVVNCATLFSDTCPVGFTTATYTVVSYPTDVYTSVTISGNNLNYTILPTAPQGTHYINVDRSCA